MSQLRNLNPYELHKHLINEYILNCPGATTVLKRDTSRDKTDIDVIKENHKFVWDDVPVDSWEKHLAKKYYDKLFKEYCICDLSRYKENKVALRWRIEKEVVMGKGQFQCGNKHCNKSDYLKSWEVNFAYVEDGEKKNSLVKVRLCPECSDKLNYKSKKREVKRIKKTKKKYKKGKNIICDESSKNWCPVASTSNSGEVNETAQTVESHWSKDDLETEQKTRDEEIEEYLEDLLL